MSRAAGRPPCVRRPWRLAGTLLLAGVLAACGGNGPTPEAPAEVTEVVATSGTSVRVSFSAAVGDGADDPVHYRLDHDGGSLSVLSAHPNEDGTAVHLATAPQASDTRYRLSLAGVRSRDGSEVEVAEADEDGTFLGSSVAAPILASAVPLDNTRILLTFVDPDGHRPVTLKETARNPAFYRLDPTLPVESVEMAYPNFVILTTAPQEDRDYELTVTNVEDSAGRLIDPQGARDTFAGIPADDAQPPAVTGAVALTDRSVQVSFSEPVRDIAADAANYEIVDGNGEALAVRQVTLNHPYDTVATLTTLPQTVGESYEVRVRNVLDEHGNAMEAPDATATFTGLGDAADGPPRVVGAGATGNRTVLVTFDKPMDRASAEVADHYGIGAEEGEGGLAVTGAALVTPTTVQLTTAPQSRIRYTVEVVNVTDAQGNHLESPSFLHPHPNRAAFTGIAPSEEDLVDSDGDGLSDVEETRGWTVTVTVANGDPLQYTVTSDPDTKDTDGDGILDGDEKAYRTDPRDADTDDDGLSDDEELNLVYSEPVLQDTDGDGLIDGLEFNFFGTSPLFADTDGDQIPDDEEVSLQNRDPRIADLPDFDLSVVGDVQLGLDVRFTAVSETGTRHLESRSSASALATSSSSSQETGSASSSEWFVNAGFNAEKGANNLEPFFSIGVDLAGGYSEMSSTSFTQASARATQQEQQNSLSTDVETEAGETITREVEGASMAVALQVENLSDVAFTLENVEVVAKVVDPRDPTSFVPVATLAGEADAYTLGPAPDERGPFRFVADSPSPALVERLRENPRNLIFEVSNYDVVDESGRNFSYTYEDVNDRTATLQIDYGGRLDEEVERVATQSGFDATGRAKGVRMQDMLEGILGLEHVPPGEGEDEDGPLRGCIADENCTEEQWARVKGSYSTEEVGEGDDEETILYRVRNIVNDTDEDGLGLRWIVSADLPDGVAPPSDFNEVRALAGRYFRLLYGEDLDGDGLTAQQEAIYGSLDAPTDELNNACFGRPAFVPHPDGPTCDEPDGTPDSRDTDRDGLPDDQEIFGNFIGGTYEPWTVAVRGQDAERTSSSPARVDTDGDGLTDCQELGDCGVYVYVYDGADTSVPSTDQTTLPGLVTDEVQDGSVLGTWVNPQGRPSIHPDHDPAWALTFPNDGRVDPSQFDTDADGLADVVELVGPRYRPLDADLGDDPVQVLPTVENDLDTACSPAEEAADFDPDAPAFDPDEPDTYGDVRFEASACHGTDPLNGDSDFDILTDGDEVQIGSDPTNASSNRDGALDDDGDGLRNIEEDVGWIVIYRDDTDTWVDHQGNEVAVTSVDGVDVPADDVDGDPIPLDERGNPVLYDDVVLADGTAPARVSSDRNDADSDGDGLNDLEERELHTNPNVRDTDGDGLTDLEEIEGTDFLIDGGIDDVRFPNPLTYDTDLDGLSDGEEANDPWTVKVAGQDPYLAYSDPTKADADLDGLGDKEEKYPEDKDRGDAHQSDPNRVDTDDDGTSDYDEIHPSGDVDLAEGALRNPTIPDQVIEVRYAHATVLETCYLIAGEGGTDGWSAPFLDQELLQSLYGGNDGGYAWLQLGPPYFDPEQGGEAIIAIDAPDDFHGDQSDQDTFSFDLKQVQVEGEQSRLDPTINLRGKNESGDDLLLYYEYDTGESEWHEATSWDTLDIPLDAASDDPAAEEEGVWRVDGTDEPATAEELASVLGSVNELGITGLYEYPSSFQGVAFAGVSFDNLRFTDDADGTHGAVSRFDTGSITSGNYSGGFKIEYPSADGGLAFDTLVTANEFSQSTAGTTTALDEGSDGIVQFVVGEEQGFRTYSTDIIEESESYSSNTNLWAYANYGHFSTDYDYPVVGGTESEVLRGQSHDNERDCALDVSWTWRVLQ